MAHGRNGPQAFVSSGSVRTVQSWLVAQPTAGYLFYLKAEGDVHRLGDTIVWVHPGSGEILFERSARN